MAVTKDIVFDSNGDLKVVNGDLSIEQSDDQNIETILESAKGNIYQFPLIGYGIYGKIGTPYNKSTEESEITEELRKDYYEPSFIEIDDDFVINIEAERTR